MSKISLSPNVSGTGTFTIASPNSNTDRTLTLPDASGTILTTATPGVPVNGPAFSAYRNGTQTGITSGVSTKVQFNAENFDTNNNFDPITNYRFTPTVAGYYQINVALTAGGTNLTYSIPYIYKNGTVYASGSYTPVATSDQGTVVTSLVYLNGSTDYVEAYYFGAVSSGTITLYGTTTAQSIFSAFLARSAT